MKQSSSQGVAMLVQARWTAQINRFGQQVTVTRRAATQGGAPTSAPYLAIPLALNRSQSGELNVEGTLNAAEPNPHEFLFAYDADVSEATDTITCSGTVYRILNTNAERFRDGRALSSDPAGLSVALHAFVVRE